MELTFIPATITPMPQCFDSIREAFAGKLGSVLASNGIEWDEDPDGRILIGVPAGHDTVFTVGPYTITLDV